MGRRLDIKPGDRFSRWTIIKEIDYHQGARHFLCRCDCGIEKMVRLTHIRQGVSRSCGCYRKEKYTTHGQSKTRLYAIWADMKQRCLNGGNQFYKLYGGRGIAVFDGWLDDFQAFYDWAINNGYKKKLTIERINNDGDYEPNNCTWITQSEQCRNRRNCHYVTYKGETKNITEWSKTLGIRRSCLYARFSSGWSVEKAFNTPSQRKAASN